MMGETGRPSGILNGLVMAGVSVAAFASSTQALDERDDLLREDLAFLAAEFKKRHVDPFRYEPEEEFDARVEEIHELIPELTNEQVGVEMMRLVGLAGDSHSGVRVQFFAGPRLPVLWRWFDDGIRVVSTLPDRAGFLGARLTAVGGRPMDEVIEILNEAAPFGNEPWMREQMPGHLRFPKYLWALGLADHSSRVEMTFEMPDGDIRREFLASLPTGNLTGLQPPTRQGPTARQPGWHYFRILDDPGIVYVQYNQCMTSDDQDLAEFTVRLVEAIQEADDLEGVVFDLQYNTGGSSLLGDAMFARVFPRLPPRVRSRAYCVIGRRTFSSGLLNAASLKEMYNATLIGEETGGGLNHFGEVRTFELPHSNLTVAYSTKEFRKVEGPGLTLEPDLRVVPTYDDYMAGRDVVWEAILEHLRADG